MSNVNHDHEAICDDILEEFCRVNKAEHDDISVRHFKNHLNYLTLTELKELFVMMCLSNTFRSWIDINRVYSTKKRRDDHQRKTIAKVETTIQRLRLTRK